MKVKGRNLVYILENIKGELNQIEIYKNLYENYKEILPEKVEEIKFDDLFPLKIYLNLLKIIGEIKGKEFIRDLGKKQGREFIKEELRIAKRFDIEWILDKASLIGELFFIGGKYKISKISENKIIFSMGDFEDFNEFAQEEILGFIEGMFEELGFKIKMNLITSPLKKIPFLELEIEW